MSLIKSILKKMNKRPEEITVQFNTILDNHLERIVSREESIFLEINDAYPSYAFE